MSSGEQDSAAAVTTTKTAHATTRHRHQRVKFVAASTEVRTTTEASIDRSEGKKTASIYASVVGLKHNSTAELVNTTSSSETSIARLLEKPLAEPPIARLPVDENSAGHRYLERYGWEPLQPRGLGARGREGRRVPVKAQIRPDNSGIGAQVQLKPASSKIKEPAKKIKKAERKRRLREKALKEERERKQLYDEIVRGR
ncbi:uncharacterized protein V2V93DRAFT_389598 [Kockiozyma suomiensis]|uniref:uncharacterized protein n=1 Tax=Kockiozyma suomiensis TaxID=1337062 RepID=UPI0033437101